ncbi:hypothetical protein [Iningainema tapete]|uniref:Uncharacterized protein n=1 Tax=Iningainema tapete BLCC-T55 TaxID=2748662 RepID=A0A8J6XM33_9CYAN|nr:hypothetical protein [Iningainema tapete]MBD2775617.1 hypothetical protein [Iningainema tapete BLCC-T55]
MSCKYADHPFPPCRFEQHPQNKNVYFCPHCRESYDVRDVGNQSPQWLLFIIGLIALILISTNNSQSLQPQKDNPTTQPTQTK